MPGAPIGLVIFDCDGVLVDSEPLAMRVLLQMLSEAGAPMAAEEAYEAFLGKSLATVCEILRRERGIAIGETALERMRRALNAEIRRDLQAMPGVHRMLEALERPFCVASSSQIERIRLSLEVTGLAGFFGDRVFSATMVTQGKPAPDLFLHAAQQMRVDPGRCMVIEDSPAGVSAALEAGMTVLGFTGGSHARSASHRHKLEALHPQGISDDMSMLPGLLAEVEKGRKAS